MSKPTITMDQARAILREISDNYRTGNIGTGPGQYPPYKIASFEDRAVYHQYVEGVVLGFVQESQSDAAEQEQPWIKRLEEAFLDASRFIPTDRTIELNFDTNRVALEIMERRKAQKPAKKAGSRKPK